MGRCIQDVIQALESGVFLEDQMKSVGRNTIKIQTTYKVRNTLIMTLVEENFPFLRTTLLCFAVCGRLRGLLIIARHRSNLWQGKNIKAIRLVQQFLRSRASFHQCPTLHQPHPACVPEPLYVLKGNLHPRLQDVISMVP